MNNFFTHPMRPFFIGSAITAIIAAFSFFVSPLAIILHRQVFLEIMLPMAYGGFLTAAMLEWTNYKGSLKTVSIPLGILVFTAFILLPFHPQISAFLMIFYWFVLLCFCAWLIWIDRNTNNFTLLLLLSAFTTLQAAYAYTQDLNLLRAQVHLHMAAVVFVSFRVSILLGSEALKKSSLKDPVFIPNLVYKNIAVTFLLIYAFTEWWLPTQTVAFTSFAVGLILLVKLRELHHIELLRQHYVRTYYWLQLFASIGYLWLGYTKLFGLVTSTPLHLIMIAGMLNAVMMVWLTAGLWHSGFTQLNYPILCRIAVICLFITAITRTVLPNIHPIFFITIPAVLLALVFLLYLITFIPIFTNRAFTDDPE